MSDWITDQLAKMAVLQPDWDGYGADPIKPEVIERMRVFLKGYHGQPGSIVPGADGSLQAEWHCSTISFGYCINPDGTAEFWTTRPLGHDE